MKKIAILVEALFEDMEVNYPYYRLKEQGYEVDLAGTEKGTVYKGKYGYPVKSNVAAGDLNAAYYDAVVIPGGYAPDHMRRHQATLSFVTEMDRRKKLIAAICHGGWILASACDIRGKKLTCFSGIKDDLIHAGADYVDVETAVDGHFITARKPEDLPSFMKAIINKLEGA